MGRLAGYPTTGQNLANAWYQGQDAQTSPSDLAHLARGWYDEKKDGGSYGWMDLIKTFNPTSVKYVVSFTCIPFYQFEMDVSPFSHTS